MSENALATQADDTIEEFETPPDEGGEIVSDDTVQQADDDTGSGDSGTSDGNEPVKPQPSPVEALATEMGWSPKDQWRGPAEQWKPADQFIRETHSINQHFKQELKQQQREFQERVERNERMAKIALQRQRQQMEDGFNQRMREAASMADTEAFDALMRQKNEALYEFDKSAREQMQQPQQPAVDPAVNDFMFRNRDWFNKDHIMTGAATQQWGYYEQNFPKWDFGQIARAVEEDMKQAFPQKFGGNQHERNANRPSAPAVEGGLRPIAGAKKKGWDALPPEAKRAGEQFIAEGIYGDDKAKAKAAYAEQYWAQ